MTEIIAPPSIWIGGEYISPSLIHREQYEKIMKSSMNLETDEIGKLMAVHTLSKISFGYKGVARRRSGDRYWEHPKAVSIIGAVELKDKSLNNSLARLLHDNDEDTVLGIEHIRYLVGSEVANLVSLVTNPKPTGDEGKDKERKNTHYIALMDNEDASKIKVSDRIHNLRTHEIRLMVDGLLEESQNIEVIKINGSKQIVETRKYIVPLAREIGGRYESLLLQDLECLERGMKKI